MLVFRYDKSFDGLLSALFDAYSMRAFPEALIGPGEPEPLFTERVHDVATDEAHAGRVWRGLERRLTARTRSMFVYAWHGEQPQGDLVMLRCLRRVFDEGGGVVADQADPDMKSLFQLALKVSHERERLKQFVRLQKAADGTYFAAVTPEHDALPLAVDYFTDRFADQRWLIYDRRRDCGYYYDGHTPPVLLVSGRDSGQLLNLFPRPEYKIAEGRLRMAFLLFCPPAETATGQYLDF